MAGASAGVTSATTGGAIGGTTTVPIAGTTTTGGITVATSTGGIIVTGGSTATAGQMTTGGSSQGTGGSATAGRSGSGGSLGTGGSATGGSLGSGGSLGTGGTATGGGSGSGGSLSTGGTATGGSSASGGSLSTGGTTIGGSTGGSSTGGSSVGGASSSTGGSTTGGSSSSGGTSSTGGLGGAGGSASGGSSAPACPGSGSYVGDSTWPDKLVVTAGATYCGHFKEMRNLEQEYAAKAKLTFAPGSYALPSTAGTYPFALPVCFERRAGEPVPAFAGAGQVKAVPSKNPSIGYASNGLVATQPIALNGSPTWTFSMLLSYFSWTGTPQPPVLDGSFLDHPSSGNVGDKNPGYLDTIELCDGTDCEDQWQDVRFEACNPDYPTYRHTIVFAGGQIALDLRITGRVGGAVMLAAFTTASGTLDGTAFSQTDYWKLVYSGDHHHFTRNFAVLFDAPIGEACGLKVLNFWGNRTSAPLPDVTTIRCDLSNIATLAVSSATLAPL